MIWTGCYDTIIGNDDSLGIKRKKIRDNIKEKTIHNGHIFTAV
jgi:hypothetical protein